MINKEKVINELDDVAMACVKYDNLKAIQTLNSAITLLKEQEPRVLEYSEFEKLPLVWLEDNDKEDVIPALFLQYNGWNAKFSRQAPDEYVSTCVRSATVYADKNTYGIRWRAWTSRPTEEQRKAVKWYD